jgi:methyl-accepting chemotaxis protein
VSLPKLSIAAKLYAIFALLAVATVVIAVGAVMSFQRHSRLTAEFEAANLGTRNVERVNGLIYAVVMDSRGIYMSPDIATAKKFAEGLLVFNDRIGDVVKDWRRTVAAEDAAQFAQFAERIRQFQVFRRELARLGTEVSPAAGRTLGDNDANRTVRTALNRDLDGLAKLYDARAHRLYAQIEDGVRQTSWILALLAVAAVALAVAGVLIIRGAVVRPLARITGITEAVAAGEAGMAVPYGERHDEIGALARSIGVFQEAIRRNGELNRTVVSEGEARARRQEVVAAEIARFGREVEATVAELGQLAERMAGTSACLATAADRASGRTETASTASAEASANVRDIAAAAEELAASVMEIDRQVVQSNAVATQAIGDAERANAEIKALDQAARRIGDVVKLITAIAEQTNLLALNATIEAARAGVAGRGFAVVAQEVKALAGQTARATEEISGQIAGMQEATLRSVGAIDAIQRTIRDVGGITATIAAAVTEQGAATREIARSAEVASRRTLQTVDEVTGVREVTTETRATSADVKTTVSELGRVASQIRAQVDSLFERLRAA